MSISGGEEVNDIKIVAEIGINHNGDVNLAKKLINMAVSCGADYVKFQKRTVDAIYTTDFLNQARESPWGKTQREQKHGLEFTKADYKEIDRYCKELGILWFASAWDLGSLMFLEDFEVPIHKIASAMLTNLEFCEEVAKIGKKTLISTGMSTETDIEKVVAIFKYHKTPFVLMHCTSMYPCPDEKTNIRTLEWLKSQYPCTELGYSGHEVGILPSVLAVAFGATWIERHITLDRASYGSDQAASLEHRGLELIVKYCREVRSCLGEARKVVYAEEIANARKMRYWEAI
jgi:N-acetylneuraminate synthase